MKVSTLLFTVFVLVAVISLVTIWFYPSVQDFMASNSMWNGLEKFDNDFNATQVDSLDNFAGTPAKSILVAIPYVDYTGDDLAKLKGFLDNGGTILLMDDYGYGNSVLTYLGVPVRFSNKPLLDPLFSFKNLYLPRITDFVPGVKESGVNVIMLNHATALTNVSKQEAVAWSSVESFLDNNENSLLDAGDVKGPLPVAARLRVGKGTLAIVSDPSVIINTMVGKDDNYAFIRYLVGGADTDKKVMVDRSHITQTPLDVSKTRLTSAHEVISSPYIVAGITALLFMMVSKYTLKKGETVG